MSKNKVPRALRLWVGLVEARTRLFSDKPVLVSAFGSDRDAIVAALEDVTSHLTIDKALFQKVTVTPGWGDAAKPTVLRAEDCDEPPKTTEGGLLATEQRP